MRFLSLIAAAWVPILVVGCTQPSVPESTANNAPSGLWNGTLIDPSDAQNRVQLRLDLDQKVPHVWSVERQQWVEAKPGKFQISRHSGSAVIYAMDSGRDEDGAWVETWVLNTALRSRGELLIEWTRVVSNVDLPASSKSRIFSQHATGTLTRSNAMVLSP